MTYEQLLKLTEKQLCAMKIKDIAPICGMPANVFVQRLRDKPVGAGMTRSQAVRKPYKKCKSRNQSIQPPPEPYKVTCELPFKTNLISHMIGCWL